MTLDIRVLELLASRICHDLVSPVGAIRNGLELIEEMQDEEEGGSPAGFVGEAVALIEHSSAQADRRLRVFRLAYGAGGREQRGFSDARTSAAGWLEGGRTRLEWPAGVPGDDLAGRRGVVKALLNTILLADEALTHGGTIRVSGEGAQGTGRLTVTAEGRPGSLNSELQAALAGTTPAASLSPRSVHAYVAGRLAADDGIAIVAAPAGTDLLVFTVSW